MARYKQIDTSPRLLPVDLLRQLLPGTFEHALNELLDHELDLACFDARYSNDQTGATAYPPAMLLKVVLFAYTQRMRERIDSPEGRARYGRRFATVEPVFGNLRHNKQLNRFTLRGQPKVDGQWKLDCLVHNIEKLAHYGYADECR